MGGPATGTVSYLGTDALGSSTVALDASGTETAAQLYDPYGNGRYSSGTMPTVKGFTGQRADATSGLDYYGARYYDPLASQFTTADSVLPGKGYDAWGLSRYAYVEGNPETRTDPSGHCWPFCAIVAALAVAVVATVADAVVQTVQNNGDMSKIDWGTALKVGAVAGVATGAVLIGGPMLAEAAGVAGATDAVGGALAAGASNAISGGIVGGIMGGAEAGFQGVMHHEDPGTILKGMAIGGLTGAAGGVVGGFTGGLIGNPVVGGMIGNGIGNGVSNFSGQALGARNGGPRYADWRSLGIATGMGAIGGAAISGVDDPRWSWAIATGVFFTAMDLGFQWSSHASGTENQAAPSSSSGAERRGDRYLS